MVGGVQTSGDLITYTCDSARGHIHGYRALRAHSRSGNTARRISGRKMSLTCCAMSSR